MDTVRLRLCPHRQAFPTDGSPWFSFLRSLRLNALSIPSPSLVASRPGLPTLHCPSFPSTKSSRPVCYPGWPGTCDRAISDSLAAGMAGLCHRPGTSLSGPQARQMLAWAQVGPRACAHPSLHRRGQERTGWTCSLSQQNAFAGPLGNPRLAEVGDREWSRCSAGSVGGGEGGGSREVCPAFWVSFGDCWHQTSGGSATAHPLPRPWAAGPSTRQRQMVNPTPVY